jgi:hypothetical protein
MTMILIINRVRVRVVSCLLSTLPPLGPLSSLPPFLLASSAPISAESGRLPECTATY